MTQTGRSVATHWAAWAGAVAIAFFGGGAFAQAPQAASRLQPRILQALPAPGMVLPPRAVIALQLSRPLAGTAQALCDIWGLRSSVPVEALQGARRQEALRTLGVPLAEQAADAPRPWIVLRCQSAFPDGASVSLQWLRPEVPRDRDDSVVGAVNTWNGQRLDYRAHSDWPLLVTCTRGNAAAGCSPLDKVVLAFQVEVAVADLANVRLKGPGGKLLVPANLQDLRGREWGDQLVFGGLAPSQRYEVVWPARLAGRNGSDVLAKGRTAQPLTVHTGDYPPLVKFGANFGIAEKATGGVVPLTVRGVEGKDTQPAARLRTLRLTDEVAIVQAYQELVRVTTADDSRAHRGGFDEEGMGAEPPAAGVGAASRKFRYAFPFPKPGTSSPDTRGIGWLPALREARTRTLPRQLEGRAFEVLGVPLPEPGFHLLEVESRTLGRGLLDTGRPMFVRSGALVTDLAVHLHLSGRTAAVFVTRLSTGQPAGDLPVTLYDCHGKRLASGRTAANGTAALPQQGREDGANCAAYVFARDGEDLGFVQSQWQRGIESWRFENVGGTWGVPSDRMVHAVLARNLLRPGEMVHARLYWRRIGQAGQLELPAASVLPATAELVHAGSGERRAVPLAWDARGNGELQYRMPPGAKRGAYTVTVGGAVTGEFRVEDFRLPVLKAEVLAPAAPQVLPPVREGSPAQLAASVRLSYLSGGAAANETVKVVQRLQPLVPSFEGHPGYWFGNDPRHRWDGDADASAGGDESVGDDKERRLDANGTLQVQASFAKPLLTPRTLVTEMEYRDPNGETYRAQGRTQVWPANFVIGVKSDPWSATPQRVAQFVVLDPRGRPVAGLQLTVEGGFDGYVSYRRKVVGGYYSYHSEQRAFAPQPLCSGRTDARGLLSCRFQPALGELDSGQFRLQASGRDAQGRIARVATQLWIYNGGEVWFGQGDNDRIDVLAEKPRYRPGEVASLQVRSPFREATAWVSVLRSGTVVDTLVVPLAGTEPTLKLPIKASYAPNVFINVLVVRGRVAEPAPTALVDLARPAFKVGIAPIEVGSDDQLLKVAVRTDRASYQSREKAKVTIQVTPQAGALPAGRDATVFVVDEALLELMPNGTWDLFKAMTARREYGFETASAAMQVIGKRHYGRKALPPGGGGGRSAARELFDTLLVWRGSVALDASGGAQLEVPINDSLTRFRVVVVANAGADRFGTGEASFVATRDLQLLSGLPASARNGDRFSAGFTVRNTTRHALQATVNATLNDQPLPAQKVALAAGQARGVSWPVDVPQDLAQLQWRLQAHASTPEGTRTDALVLRQPVETARMPVRYTVGLRELQGGADPVTAPVQPPPGSIAGLGEVRVSLTPALAADASGVRDFMRHYPFFCLEQRTSKAVSLKDKALWAVITDNIDSYVTRDGMLTYYPGEPNGYDVLTSYVLSVGHEAGFQLPPQAQRSTLDALEQFVRGSLEMRYGYYADGAHDLTERKLLALEALARHRKLDAKLLESLRVDAAKDLPQLSHRAIVQWLDVLHRSELPLKATAMKAALAELEGRLMPDGRGGLRLRARPQENRWYLMWSEPVSQVRLALLALELPALKDRATLLAQGAVNMQRGGATWWDTQANVWGTLLLDKRAAQASGKIGGITSIAVGTTTRVHDWARQPEGETYVLPATGITTARPGAVAFVHRGSGSPVAQATATAWTEPTQPQQNRAEVTRSVRPLRQAAAGRWSAGDIAEVTLRFRLFEPMGWVVLSDPIPSGATILGSGLKGQDAVQENDGKKRGWRNADGSWEQTPTYVERSFTYVRAYYEDLGGSHITWTYQLRINNAGVFKLPPTQLEAMYAPDVSAVLPQPPLEVK